MSRADMTELRASATRWKSARHPPRSHTNTKLYPRTLTVHYSYTLVWYGYVTGGGERVYIVCVYRTWRRVTATSRAAGSSAHTRC